MNGVKERLCAFGVTAISDAELISLVLGRGTDESTAKQVIEQLGPPSRLKERRVAELAQLPGIGSRKAEKLLAALELGMRASIVPDTGSPLMSAADVRARWVRLASEPNEAFVAIAVNSRNRVTGEWVIQRGWEAGINLQPRQVFSLLMKEGVSRCLFVHNHPSGDATPSPEDVRFTRRLLEAAKMLDIRVLDHVVIAATGHASIREVARGELDFG